MTGTLTKVTVQSDVIGRDRTGCWTDGDWYHDADGYGLAWIDGVWRRVHRYALELDSGVEGGELHALHSCDTPACWNPDHLRWGTDVDNVKDRDARGRKAEGRATMNGWTEKMTEETVREARGLHAQGFSKAELSRMYGVTDATMGKLINRKTWKWVD